MVTPAGGGAPAMQRPGFGVPRMAGLMRAAVAATGLDLHGLTVLTEAATGAYGVTAPIAALAGARRVLALARPGRHGSAAEARAWTMALAEQAGIAGRVSVVEALPDGLGCVDIVTNSGHLRPIDAALVGRLPARAVVALMFEAWEFRDGDIDVAACRARGVRIAGVNERHSSVDVFSYLGPLCVRLLQDAGLPVYRNRIALLCDNAFGPSMLKALTGLGASVETFESAERVPAGAWDSVLVALHPGSRPRIGQGEAAWLARAAPGALVAQFWGDMDRDALAAQGLAAWPPEPPRAGHMAILLSDIGPEAIVRLQAGGLRAAEWIFRGGQVTPRCVAQLV